MLLHKILSVWCISLLSVQESWCVIQPQVLCTFPFVIPMYTLKVFTFHNLLCFPFEFKWKNKVIHWRRLSQTVTMKHSLLLHLFSIGVISAQSPGSCPDLRGIPDFKTLDYTGRWYEYASTSTNYSQGNDNSCVRAMYSDYGNGVIGVFNEAIQ